jgi:hypothetical protein
MSEQEVELKETGPNGRVVPVHSTSVDLSSAWDRTAQFKKMRSPATPSYYNDIFAFQLPNTKGTRKTHYSFIHHFVGSDGAAGEASGRALANSVAVLNGGRQGTVLRGAARQGVYRHIAAHYKDADREAPELKSDEDVDAIMMFKGLIDAPLAETLDLTVKGLEDLDNIIDVESDVSWMEGDQEFKGIVVEADDDVALVEQIDEKDARTGEFYELDYAEIKLRTFVVMEKADGMPEKGAIVSWDTSKGKYYGDVVEVVTDGMARGEPQGLEIEGSEDNPAFVIRVWMKEEYEEEEEPEDDEDMEESSKSAKSEGEWHSTNVTVVARGDGLTVEEALPTGDGEDDYDSEEEDDEETAMKSIDPEFSALVKRVIEQNAEVLKRLAELDSEEKSDVVEETPVAEETVVEEVKAEDVVAAVEETSVEETPATETLTEEVKAEEVVTEEAKAEETPAEEQPVVEAKASISFDELKEFHNLLKEITKQ